MLTNLLERNSWIIAKIGMPLVFFYHVIVTSVFFNTAADDARGLEKLANTTLAPFQYFFEGKRAVPQTQSDGTVHYVIQRRFGYDEHFFVKAAITAPSLPFSILIGGTLKSLCYLSSDSRERARNIYAALHNETVISNLPYYQSIGMQIENYNDAALISPPKYKRHPGAQNKLGADLEALKAIVAILSEENIPFWVDCGTCLGTYQYGGAIPHDWDIDIGMLKKDFHNVKNALQKLDPDKFVVQDWSGRKNPESYLKVYVHESGGMIDLYNFEIDEENQQIHTFLSNEFNIFLPPSWVIREKRYTIPMDFATVFPLKKGVFDGIEVPVPGNTEKYLQTFYGENLAPAKLFNETTGQYEKDLNHPYWQLPHAH